MKNYIFYTLSQIEYYDTFEQFLYEENKKINKHDIV